MLDMTIESVETIPKQKIESHEDARLVSAAKQDRTKFSALYRKYASGVYRFIYVRVRNREEAEDITSQVFFEALKKLDNYRERQSFAGWLFTIARRRLIDHQRKQKPTAGLDQVQDLESELSVWKTAMQNESMEQLLALVLELSADKQELLTLRFVGDLTYREIAEVLGKREPAVKMSLRRLLDQLRAEWEARYDQ